MPNRRYSRRTKRYIEKVIYIIGINIILITLVIGFISIIYGKSLSDLGIRLSRSYSIIAPYITEMLLTPNQYSRPGTPMNKVNGIVVHYTANPGTGASNNRNYFEGLKDTGNTYASSHFIIGIDGEIIQCVPLNEIAYASNNRNDDTISIECCHPDKDGRFTKETYDSLVWLTAWLSNEYKIKNNNIIRHYDVTGKICPKYYVDNEDEWELFKGDVLQYYKDNRVKNVKE